MVGRGIEEVGVDEVRKGGRGSGMMKGGAKRKRLGWEVVRTGIDEARVDEVRKGGRGSGMIRGGAKRKR